MNILEQLQGLTDKDTGDYYVNRRILFVWRGKVVGSWIDPISEYWRKDISMRWWKKFMECHFEGLEKE